MALTRPGVTRDCEPECPASALALVRVRVECVVTGHQPLLAISGVVSQVFALSTSSHLRPPPATSSPLQPPPATSSHLQPPPAPSTLHTPLCRGKLQVVSARARHHLTITSHQSPAHTRPGKYFITLPPPCCLLLRSSLPICLHQCSAARLASPESVQEGAVPVCTGNE